jgi:ADP-ribose pyrophosphatase
MDRFIEKTIDSHRVFEGRLLKVDSVDVELADGRKSVREIVQHPGAVAVLVRGDDKRYVFVHQYRKPAEKVMLEVVAGTLEENEDPAECARRETAEETGMTVTALEKLGVIYPSPGYSSEKLHLFLADAVEGAEGHEQDADENIERVSLSESEIDGMVQQGSIDDAKTLASWLLMKTKGRS